MQYRQGDIFLKKIDLLPEVKECTQSMDGPEIPNMVVLALGEATGHKHKFYKQHCRLVKSANDETFFLVVDSPSDLTHEEHSTITVIPGFYRVIRQREYSPQEIRYVAD